MSKEADNIIDMSNQENLTTTENVSYAGVWSLEYWSNILSSGKVVSAVSNEDENIAERSEYRIRAVSENETSSIEYWSNILSSGKIVTIEYTTLFSEGDFTINLTDTEKEEIVQLEQVALCDYDNVCCEELHDGYAQEIVIQDAEEYTNAELTEIKDLIYANADYTDDTDLSTDKLDANGWSLEETAYCFTGRCEVIPIDEEWEDDAE